MTRSDVFLCPSIGRHLTVGACLRRQVEPSLVTVVVREASEDPNHGNRTRLTEQRPAGPAYPECAAGTCEIGRKHAAAEIKAEAPPRRPSRPLGGRVWSDEVPDVPIGAAPATSEYSGYRPQVCYAPWSTSDAMLASLAERRRRREAAQATNQSASSTDTPAEPAPKEEAMPKRVRAGGPCKGCGAKGARCKGDCPTKGASAPAAPKAAPPAKGGRRVDLAVRQLDGDALLARRDALLAELAAVEEQLADTLEREEARIDRLRAAVEAAVSAARKVAAA